MRSPAIDVVGLLAYQPLFKDLPEASLRRAAEQIREQRLGRGETLFHCGTSARDGFWVIVFGQVKLAFPSSSGNEKVLATLTAKQSFGETEMLLDVPYSYSAEALCDCLLLRVDRSVVTEAHAQSHPLMRGLLDSMAVRTRYLVNEIERISMHTGRERVVGYLLRHCPGSQEDGAPGGELTVPLPVTKQLLASRLNLKPETLSRIFHELVTEGLIHVEGKHIAIPDRDRLRAFHHG